MLKRLLTFIVFWVVKLVQVSSHFLRRFFVWLLDKSEQAVQACIISLDSFSLVLRFEHLNTLAKSLGYEFEILATDLALRHGDLRCYLLHDILRLTGVRR